MTVFDTQIRALIIRMNDAKNPDRISIARSDFDIFIHWNTPCHRISVKVMRSLPNRRHHILSSLNLLCHINPLCYPVDNLIIGRTRCSEIRKPITNRSIEIIAAWLISDCRRPDWREYIVVFATIRRKKKKLEKKHTSTGRVVNGITSERQVTLLTVTFAATEAITTYYMSYVC